MRAAGEQRDQDHQIRQREQPLIRLNTRRFRGPRDEPQMTTLGKIPEVLDANTRQGCNLGIRKNLLARFDGNHDLGPLYLSALTIRCLGTC